MFGKIKTTPMNKHVQVIKYNAFIDEAHGIFNTSNVGPGFTWNCQ